MIDWSDVAVGRPGELDADVRQLLDLAAAMAPPTLDTMTPEAARAEFARRVAAANPLPPDGVETEDFAIADGRLGIRRYGTPGPAALLYIHGGGFVVGDLETVDPICRILAARTGTTVLSVDYRLAPEHPYPAAVEDVCAALEWAAAHHSILGVAGDSGGATLAAVAALHARDAGLPLALQLLVYPAVDQGRGDYPSRAEFASGYLLNRSEIAWFGRHYFGQGSPPHLEWQASPLHAASHAGAAPAVVLVAGFDPLRDEGLAYARTLRQAGVPVRSVCFHGSVHGCLNMGRYQASGMAMLDELCRCWQAAAR